ncbi:carbamoyltransferase HypF [Campylobacter sp. 10_1_50]|uniref:carbamoyltransferase HypF n=1 Tax=Campylobacter TaxID=194 RepID=UPI0002410536|nr:MULTISPECIES: carbamoyltransferase HypF [Campylobacter]EHL91245.1 carbamoyltransferase HypF [Campylobacter sp. 10_1_50]
MRSSFRYEIKGLVQGVGFRPFVYTLADKFKLVGEIYNDDEGVKLNFSGEEASFLAFEKELYEKLPALARIDELKKFKIDKIYEKLEIIASKSATKQAPILPDYALCDDCLREFYDPTNPRYKYPFINCTNCGPRFSIIKALPYDRVNTTMNEFKMCEFCESEYKDPLNRRYHAEPISCPNCGPKLYLKDKFGKVLASKNEAAKEAARLINEGKILAIKGLGGFHLVCDATNEAAVCELRARKHRPSKPFALMSKNLQNARKIAQISEAEAKLLSSNLKPIVLLEAKNGSNIAKSVAPNLNKLGVMLAFSGIHLLLFDYLEYDIIATSANISGEVVIKDESELREKLGDVIDFYLDHDREIYSPSDDSIAFCVGDEVVFTRTSRGLNPNFIHTNFKQKGTFLALGAELKSSFCIYKDGLLMVSPYIGDLKNVATFDRFKDIFTLFERTYDLKIDKVIADLHPNFLNTKWAKDQGFELVHLQHHYAHLLSVIFENDLPDKEYLGFCFDGTGYAEDGKIWGGEVFRLDKKSYKRVCHFDEFSLFGGENSIKNIYLIAYSIILKYELEDEGCKFLVNFDEKVLRNFKMMEQKGLNLVKTSSVGRIFDAFGAIICGISHSSFEGESGMRLEALYNKNLDVCYKFSLNDGVIGFKEAFKSALKDEPRVAATAFINGMADIIFEISKNEKKEILLSGGVFQNKTLLELIYKKFTKANLKFYINKKFCSNDSNVNLGQIYYYLSTFSNK